MANTENIEAKLCAYVDGELDAAGRAEIEAHLAGNPQHRQLMTELMAHRELLRGLPRSRAPEDLLESVQNTLERSVLLDGAGATHEEEAHVAGRINPWPRVFGIAAVLVLGIGLAAMIFLILPGQKPGDFAIITTPPAPSTAPSGLDALASGTDAGLDRGARGTGQSTGEPTAAGTAPKTDDIVSKTAAPHPGETPVASKSADANIFDQTGGGIANNTVATTGGGGGTFGQQLFNSVPALDPSVVEEQLKQAPAAVPDNSMLVVVAASDPSLANRRVQEFLTSNAIRWEEVSEPMPQPLAIEERQRLLASRSQNTQVRLKEGPPTAEQLQLQQQSGQVAQAPAAPSAGASSDALTLNRSIAEPKTGPADASSRPPMSKGGAEPLADAASGSKSAAAPATPGASPLTPGASPTPDAPSGTADAVAKADAGSAPNPENTKSENRSAKDVAPTPPTQAQQQREASSAQRSRLPDEQHSVEQQQQVQAGQSTTGPQQPATEALTPAAQKDKEASPKRADLTNAGAPTDIASATTIPTLATPDVAAFPTPYGSQQVLIARGLTRQQVNELYACVSDQNAGRVANYHRSGGNYTPATLPAAAIVAARDNLHLQKSSSTTHTNGAGEIAPAPPAPAPPADFAAATPPPASTAPAGAGPAGAFGLNRAEVDLGLARPTESAESTAPVATAPAGQPAPAPGAQPVAEPTTHRAFTGGAIGPEAEPSTPAPLSPPAGGEPRASAVTRDDVAPVPSPAPPPTGPVSYPPESTAAQAPAPATQPTAPTVAAPATTQPTAIAGAGAPAPAPEAGSAAAVSTTQPTEPRLDVVIVLQADVSASQQQLQAVDPIAPDASAPNTATAPDAPAAATPAPNGPPSDAPTPTTTPAAQ